MKLQYTRKNEIVKSILMPSFLKSNKFVTDRELHKFIANNIGDMENVESGIHRIALSCPKSFMGDAYAILTKELNNPKVEMEYPKNRMSNYSKLCYFKFMGRNITCFFAPINDFLPRFRLEISNPTFEILCCLNKKIPLMKVSSFEFSFDFFFNDKEARRLFFWGLSKTLYIPWGRGPKNIPEVQYNKYKSSMLQVPVSKTVYAKCYERGLDNNKTGKSWLEEKIDRVRLEFTFKSGYRFQNNQISSLENFLTSLNMETLLHKKFDFLTFIPKHKENDSVLNEKEFFRKVQKDGSPVPFQSEYIHHRKTNVSNFKERYTKSSVAHNQLKIIIFNEIKSFDFNWRKKEGV